MKHFNHANQWTFAFVVYLGFFVAVTKVDVPLSFVYPLNRFFLLQRNKANKNLTRGGGVKIVEE